ncbi:MAG: hypothetical protein LBH00_08530, partial [Planctomycetaceae bacterium]|nr:hypothetical protein [Planctomycetaceae bacterium]
MRRFLCVFLLAFAVAFAGCEPANNSGNSGNTPGNNDGTGDPANPDENGETPTPNPDAPAPDMSDLLTADTGKWDIAVWQASLDAGYCGGKIAGADSLTAFCIWANQYFPEGIPRHPGEKSGDWNASEWGTYFEAYPEIKESFPGTWDTFFDWAKANFTGKHFILGMYAYTDIPFAPKVVIGSNYEVITDATGRWYDDGLPSGCKKLTVPEGNWVLADWQRYVDSQEGGIPGVENTTQFITWANKNFPEGIPSVPEGQSGDAWNSEAWRRWFATHQTESWQNSVNTWETFLTWAKETYGDGDMPYTPPGMTGSGSSSTPADPNEDGNTGETDTGGNTGGNLEDIVQDVINGVTGGGTAASRTAGLAGSRAANASGA